MADVKIVKSLYTAGDVTSLGEVAAADNARLPGTLQVDGVATLAGLVVPGYTNRNAIINGAMDIWQRGTATLTNPVTATYFPDRFRCTHALGDGTYSLLQSAETPAVGFPFQYSLQVDCTAAETAVAAGENMSLRYVVEGYDFKRFEGEVATLSFWVKAVKTGIYCVAFRNSAGDKSYVHEFTINSASTWEKKTVTLTFNSGGTFLYTVGIGVNITWCIMGGSTSQIATANKDTWQAGNYQATDAQVNGLDNTNNNFWLTGIQLELGSIATPFEFRSFQQELAMCQRYCVKLSDITMVENHDGVRTDAATMHLPLYYPPMRAVPTLVGNDIVSWDADGSPAAGSASAIEKVTPAWITITGALTVSLNLATLNRATLQFAAGTSFSGATGINLSIVLNATRVGVLSADL